jgi:6-phosphogluconate dehydrogenase
MEIGFVGLGRMAGNMVTRLSHAGQAYAEGFELLSASDFALDLPRIAAFWNRGSVVRSWLLELAADAIAANPGLEGLKPYVEDSGEGHWTVIDAVEKAVPAPTITAALFARFRSRRANSYADRLLAALRNAFGGHAIHR